MCSVQELQRVDRELFLQLTETDVLRSLKKSEKATDCPASAQFVLFNSRKNKIYEKRVASAIENCKRKSNYAKGKFKTFQIQGLLNYGYSVDLPFH